MSIGVVGTIWSGVLDEILETYALAVGNPAHGESMWLPTSLLLRKSRQREMRFPGWYIAPVGDVDIG
jgi:hypothetical protein